MFIEQLQQTNASIKRNNINPHHIWIISIDIREFYPSTTQKFVLNALNHIVLFRAEEKARQAAIGTTADPVMLEVFNNLFMSIAEQMGVTLQNTSYSVNMKERLDFSCAVFASSRSSLALLRS